MDHRDLNEDELASLSRKWLNFFATLTPVERRFVSAILLHASATRRGFEDTDADGAFPRYEPGSLPGC